MKKSHFIVFDKKNERFYKKTYLCFNDESGDLGDNNNNFYVRVSLIINTINIKSISDQIIKIKKKFQLNELNEEIKWQDLWLLRKCFNKKKKIKNNHIKKIYSFLNNKGKDYHWLINYVGEIISLIKNPKYDIGIIITFTENLKSKGYNEKKIIGFHIQDHLQRIQMQYSDALVLIIYDSINDKYRKDFKEIHNKIVQKGDFIKNYKSIFDSLLFDDSYDNKFIQLTDFISGCCLGLLRAIKKNDLNNYSKAVKFFKDAILDRICKNNKKEIWGVGIKETPKNDDLRQFYKQKFKEFLGLK